MKITQIPIGTRFSLDGKIYVKTGPMVASCNGAQKLIPKHAVLSPVDGMPVQQSNTSGELVSRAEVLLACETFYNECQALLPADRHADLLAARERLLQAINQSA